MTPTGLNTAIPAETRMLPHTIGCNVHLTVRSANRLASVPTFRKDFPQFKFVNNMIKIVKGDLLLAREAAICHQVNCQNMMGAGVAKAIYTKWPEVKSEYHRFCEGKRPRDLLGKAQIVQLHDFPAGNKVVVNIFGQLNCGHDKICYTRYDALATAFDKLNQLAACKTLAFPYGFGCGLANGDWMQVERLMLEHLTNVDVTIYMK